ncbi:Protein CBG25520 [Caenorhabditis briggsae]|uniref:Protein CBG25520 n=2 Tax=Caenorhabditis briggsae TaxID=6238 RepID=B6IFP5_CAEBR|nr:Protein CBG25520 [Caenorhabditis briggsae]ULU04867.1 hypothetical protein L3Y34_017547 [Caenorhabditis briggsae]CAR98725.1 Protein CBG25520 [Caenorhabditis briggsae]
MYNFLKIPDEAHTPGCLFQQFIRYSFYKINFSPKGYVRSNGWSQEEKKIAFLQNLMEEMGQKSGMFGSAEELLENLKIYADFPGNDDSFDTKFEDSEVKNYPESQKRDEQPTTVFSKDISESSTPLLNASTAPETSESENIDEQFIKSSDASTPQKVSERDEEILELKRQLADQLKIEKENEELKFVISHLNAKIAQLNDEKSNKEENYRQKMNRQFRHD